VGAVAGEDRTAGTGGQGATGRQRLSVAEAAVRLGSTVEAIRKRAQRGTIAHERDEEGHVWILLDTDRTRPDTDQDTDRAQLERDELISAKNEVIATLREQLESERQGHAEARRLLLRALERIPPAIEAPESPESRSSSATTPPGASREAHETAERPDSEAPRSWWRRVFGGS
jgi:hypothetical protein